MRCALLALGAALLAGACVAIEQPPELARSSLALPAAFAAAPQADAAPVADAWLADFGDEQLLALVEEALHHNPDLAVAAARWEEARARLQVVGSFLEPRLDAFASAQGFDQGEGDAQRYDLGLQVGWEPDLWGRLRSGEAAALETALASASDHAAARQSLAAAVADAWFLSIAARQQIAIFGDLLEAERFTARVTRDKIEVGATSRLDAEVAEANLSLAENALQQGQGALLETQKALETLLGRYPAAEVEVAAELPVVPPPSPLGLPSELLERRPDVVAADRRVAAAFHNVEAAQAARLPRVVLSASLGKVLDPTETIWSLGANLLAPLFDGGELQGEVRIATAQQRAALAGYVSVALSAFREVESALANEQILVQRQGQLEQADQHLRSASSIAQDRYDAGIIGILDLTQVRRQDYTTRSQLLEVRAERLRQRLKLYLALGGSFDGETEAP